MDKKLGQTRNCFHKESCKNFLSNYNHDLINDPILKARILDAEVHKDLLNRDFQPVQECAPENCWECTNTLC